MAQIVLFHSILGLRDVEYRIADLWRDAGHTVVLPDLFEKKIAADYEEGFALKDAIGEEIIQSRAEAVVGGTQGSLVLAGVSFGAFLIGGLWERSNVIGSVLLSGVAPWMEPRRPGFPVSVHVARPDPFDEEEFFGEWIAEAQSIELAMHRYDDAGHYFLDETLPDYHAEAAKACLNRTRDFLTKF